MKALVYTGPHAMELREVAEPVPQDPGEVLIKVEACGICGSDMHAWHGHDERRPAPLVLGHEAVGTIVSGARAGQRVAINPLVTCQDCEFCRDGRDNLCGEREIISMPPRQGGFSEYLTMPERNLIEVPDGVALTAATLAEPLACGWHAVRLARGALFKPLEAGRVLVLGGGAIGLGAALAARLHGASEIWIAETNAMRHPALRAAGEFMIFDPGSGPGPAEGELDLVIDAVGYAATRAAACNAVKPGGVIVHIGLGEAAGGLDVRRMTLQEVTVIGTYTYTARDFRDTAQAIFAGSFGALDWADVRPLAEGAAAFRDIDGGQVAAPKIILIP